MQPFVAEVIGTALLILFGNGVVANVVLARTKGHGGGWLLITAGWGMGVFIGAFCAAAVSGAHLNPAVTVAMLIAGKMDAVSATSYILAQFIGACLGATLVYLHYHAHFESTEDGDAILSCFCTAPAIRRLRQAFVCEFIGTFALLLPIFLMASPSIQIESLEQAGIDGPVLGLGALGLLPVALLVVAIGMSLGGTTGYAINPARDLGPRLIHCFLPIRGKRDSDWGYAWVPVLGPLAGGAAAALLYRFLLAA